MTDPVLDTSINEGDTGALAFFDHLAQFHNDWRTADGSAHYVPADFQLGNVAAYDAVATTGGVVQASLSDVFALQQVGSDSVTRKVTLAQLAQINVPAKVTRPGDVASYTVTNADMGGIIYCENTSGTGACTVTFASDVVTQTGSFTIVMGSTGAVKAVRTVSSTPTTVGMPGALNTITDQYASMTWIYVQNVGTWILAGATSAT